MEKKTSKLKEMLQMNLFSRSFRTKEIFSRFLILLGSFSYLEEIAEGIEPENTGSRSVYNLRANDVVFVDGSLFLFDGIRPITEIAIKSGYGTFKNDKLVYISPVMKAVGFERAVFLAKNTGEGTIIEKSYPVGDLSVNGDFVSTNTGANLIATFKGGREDLSRYRDLSIPSLEMNSLEDEIHDLPEGFVFDPILNIGVKRDFNSA